MDFENILSSGNNRDKLRIVQELVPGKQITLIALCWRAFITVSNVVKQAA